MEEMRNFRGKPVRSTAFGADFVYGDKFESACGKVFIIPEGHRANQDHDTEDVFWQINYLIEVLPDNVGQSIGLVDRNNKEMYFDDIVLWNGKRYVIIWNITCLGIYLQPVDNYAAKKKDPKIGRLVENLMYGRAVYLEVIGNIHEHPNLLKETNENTKTK